MLGRACFLVASVAIAIVIAALQGYFFVPTYRYLYVAFAYLAKRFRREGEEKAPLSGANLACDVGALLIACLLLLIPYRLYFALAADISRWINYYWIGSYFAGFIVFRVRQEIEISEKRARRPIFVDLARRDDQGRLLLDSFWTLRDLERHWISLRRGLRINVYSYASDKAKDELIYSSGIAEFDEENKRWVLALNEGEEVVVSESELMSGDRLS